MRHFYISVAGVMGSGKTSISHLLAEKLGFHFFEENVKENIFLPRYYQNPGEWALHSQLFYLREKAAQLLKLKELLGATNIIQDTPIYQDCFGYAKAQHRLSYMSDEDYRLYLSFFELLQPQLPVPDLIIQLDAAAPILEERIRRRGRDYEKFIDRNYLELLSELQDEWIAKNSHLRVIRLRTDNAELDVLKNLNYQQELFQDIKTAIIGRS
jgi:deoxyadenosine/deoxycytidine kinase